MKFIIRVLVTTCAVMLTAWLLEPHVMVANFWAGLMVALVLAVLNAFVRPILLFISIPATILSMGLFIFVINAMIILLADYLIVEKFQVENFWWALLFSLIVSFISSILNSILKTDTSQNQ